MLAAFCQKYAIAHGFASIDEAIAWGEFDAVTNVTPGMQRLRACLATDLQAARWCEVECPDVPTIYDRVIAAFQSETTEGPDVARGAQLQPVLDIAEQSSAKAGQSQSI